MTEKKHLRRSGEVCHFAEIIYKHTTVFDYALLEVTTHFTIVQSGSSYMMFANMPPFVKSTYRAIRTGKIPLRPLSNYSLPLPTQPL